MKKLVLVLTMAAFAVAAQAGEGCSKDKAACAGKNKAACASKDATAAKGNCPSKMSACSKSTAEAKATCPKARKISLMSPKVRGETLALN